MPRTVVVLSARLGPVLPAAALPALRAATHVLADATVPTEWLPALGVERAPDGWQADDPIDVQVLLTLRRPPAEVAGSVVGTVEPPGAGLLDAVAVMDRLRSPGGCPWDAEQTHRSLLQYLVEECYELHEAIDDTDRPALREELGDVLLQVLFHARLAVEGGVEPYPPGDPPFGIDEVAADLVRKLVDRHPHVFGSGPAIRTAADQQRRWDELKRVEKCRDSCLDGVALGQPAAALAAKLVSRAVKAGVPVELMVGRGGLFGAVAEERLAGTEPEQRLRAEARRFAANVRAAEDAARSDGRDPHRLTEREWRRFWPAG
jgi:XTP/dITP diphosphohydrolase